MAELSNVSDLNVATWRTSHLGPPRHDTSKNGEIRTVPFRSVSDPFQVRHVSDPFWVRSVPIRFGSVSGPFFGSVLGPFRSDPFWIRLGPTRFGSVSDPFWVRFFVGSVWICFRTKMEKKLHVQVVSCKRKIKRLLPTPSIVTYIFHNSQIGTSL